MSVWSASLGALAQLAFMLVLYFAVSPASSAHFGMFFAGSQVLAHGVVWWIAERRR